MPSPNTLPLIIVVNGVETAIDANLQAPLRVVVERALAQTHNTGRPASDWELKDANGHALALEQKVGALELAAGAVLYLTLAVGVNGAIGA